MEIRLLNPFLSRSERNSINSRLKESQDAILVATGIEIARVFRRR